MIQEASLLIKINYMYDMTILSTCHTNTDT